MKKVFTLLFFLTLLGLSVAFTAKNFSSVSFSFLFGTVSFPLALLLYSSLIFGLLLGLLVNFNILLKYRRENRQLKSETESNRAELSKLRGIPYTDIT